MVFQKNRIFLLCPLSYHKKSKKNKKIKKNNKNEKQGNCYWGMHFYSDLDGCKFQISLPFNISHGAAFSFVYHVLFVLNTFHQNTEFRYELKQNDNINRHFIISKTDTSESTLYRKSNHNCVSLRFKLFAPRSWKHSKL